MPVVEESFSFIDWRGHMNMLGKVALATLVAGTAVTGLSTPAAAQSWGHDRHDHDRGWDRGGHRGWDRGEHRGWDRGYRHGGWDRGYRGYGRGYGYYGGGYYRGPSYRGGYGNYRGNGGGSFRGNGGGHVGGGHRR